MERVGLFSQPHMSSEVTQNERKSSKFTIGEMPQISDGKKCVCGFPV